MPPQNPYDWKEYVDHHQARKVYENKEYQIQEKAIQVEDTAIEIERRIK